MKACQNNRHCADLLTTRNDWIRPVLLQSLTLTLALMITGAPHARADFMPQSKDPYFEISNAEVVELQTPSPLDVSSSSSADSTSASDSPPSASPTSRPLETPSGRSVLDEIEARLDQIINIGKKVWAIVEANKPVIDTTYAPGATALPAGTRGWQELENWQTPKVRTYRVNYRNGFGMNVVEFTYRLTFTPGGQLQGRGRYLSEINVESADLSVLWGFTFRASSQVPAVFNVGTHADPVAGAHVVVSWSVESPLRTMRESHRYFVRADGSINSLVQ